MPLTEPKPTYAAREARYRRLADQLQASEEELAAATPGRYGLAHANLLGRLLWMVSHDEDAASGASRAIAAAFNPESGQGSI